MCRGFLFTRYSTKEVKKIDKIKNEVYLRRVKNKLKRATHEVSGQAQQRQVKRLKPVTQKIQLHHYEKDSHSNLLQKNALRCIHSDRYLPEVA